MADTVTTTWIYPPNWDGYLPHYGGWRKVVVQLTNSSDGTGESGVTKIDISSLRTTNSEVPARTVIERIVYKTKGVGVRVEWDRTSSKLIAEIPPDASDFFSWLASGGKVDPGEAGDKTGDILFTTIGASAGDTYDITITLRLKA